MCGGVDHPSLCAEAHGATGPRSTTDGAGPFTWKGCNAHPRSQALLFSFKRSTPAADSGPFSFTLAVRWRVIRHPMGQVVPVSMHGSSFGDRSRSRVIFAVRECFARLPQGWRFLFSGGRCSLESPLHPFRSRPGRFRSTRDTGGQLMGRSLLRKSESNPRKFGNETPALTLSLDREPRDQFQVVMSTSWTRLTIRLQTPADHSEFPQSHQPIGARAAGPLHGRASSRF